MANDSESLSEWLERMRGHYDDLEVSRPAPQAIVSDAERQLGTLPDELKQLYALSNGIACRSFSVWPVFDESNPRKTWNSIQRANAVGNTEVLGGDAELLARFLAFADIGNGFALWDRSDRSIWFEEVGSENVEQTDLSFREFIETMLKNAE